jgi:hypothetical protein
LRIFWNIIDAKNVEAENEISLPEIVQMNGMSLPGYYRLTRKLGQQMALKNVGTGPAYDLSQK